MLKYLGRVLETEMDDEVSNLVYIGCKNMIASKRAACFKIKAIQQKPKYSQFSDGLATYKQSIQTRLSKDC